MTASTTGTSPPTRFAITLAGVFLASMIGTFALWASIEPDCARADIAAFEAHCADATSTP
jgi:hypothetical protein